VHAVFDGFVRDGDAAGVLDADGQLAAGGEVEVGEDDLALADLPDFLGQRFLHLADQIGLGPDLVGGVDDGCAERVILFVGQAAAGAGAAFDQHGVAGLAKLLDAGGCHCNAILIRLNFLGNADDHPYRSCRGRLRPCVKDT
jgi:hypothetical protein